MKPELHPDVLAFIQEHENADTVQLRLKHNSISGFPISFAIDQISGRRKAKEKLPSLYKNPNIIYPPGVNLEQSSSEQTALFKKSLIENHLSPFRGTTGGGGSGADLTGGFGIDTYYLSKITSEFHYVEPDAELLEIARHNHQQLRRSNIIYHAATAEDFLSSCDLDFDFIFIDPSRRDNSKKVFVLKDCTPDVTILQNKVLSRTKLLLIKASPLLDIQAALKELNAVKKVIVLAVENECKELLFLCEDGFNNEPQIAAVNTIGLTKAIFEFKFSEEKASDVMINDPLAYLYEPNAAILKAGAFKSIAHQFGLSKIHPITHFYTSESLNHDFPGRVFKVLGFPKADSKSMREFFPDAKANVTTRNYPLSVEELKKKTGIKDGGDKFLIGFSGLNKKYLVAADRIR